MNKMTRYLLNRRMNRGDEMRMGQGEMQNRKFGFGSDEEMQNRGGEYRSEYRARRGNRGGYREGQQPSGRYPDYYGYDERYGNDMRNYGDRRGNY